MSDTGIEKGTILRQALDVVENRGQSYGHPYENHVRIMERWQRWDKVPWSPAKVALMMVDLKLARLENDPQHWDSLVDIAGYAHAAGEILRREEQQLTEAVTTDAHAVESEPSPQTTSTLDAMAQALSDSGHWLAGTIVRFGPMPGDVGAICRTEGAYVHVRPTGLHAVTVCKDVARVRLATDAEHREALSYNTRQFHG